MTTLTPISKCTVENPDLCRIHGNKQKIKFEKKAVSNLAWAKTNLEKAENKSVDDYMYAKEIYEHAELEYYSTLTGEKELQDQIAAAQWPENEILEEKLKAANKLRLEIEAKDAEAYTYTFPESKLEDALHRIEKANRKLERAGIKERFTADTEYFTEEGENGEKFSMVKLQLNHPPLSVDGWDFVAAVDEAENGLVTRVMPGQELGGYKPESMICDHCGRKRFRKATYLIRNEQGEYKQVGSSCLEPFLGMSPKGLWALEFDMEENNRLDDGRRVSGGVDSVVPLQDTVAIALAVSDNGKSFKSKAYAQETFSDSTSDMVRNELFGLKKDKKKLDYSEYMDKAAEVIQNTKFEGDNDYVTNMRTILDAENVKAKHIGYAVSVVSAYNRQHEDIAAKKAKIDNAPSGFLGEVGEKFTNKTATVKIIKHDENPYSYNGEKVSWIVLRTDDNKEVVWSASKYLDFEPGDKVNIAKGKVKNHKTYNGNDQTSINYAKIELISREDDAESTDA